MIRERKLHWAKVAVVMGAIPVILWAYEYGPDVGYAGVPNENGDCSACHVGIANHFGGSVTVTFPNGATYTPGVTQALQVTIADPATTQKAWGFQLTARQSSSTSTQAGTFASINGFTQVLCSNSSLDPNRELSLLFGSSQTCPASQPLSYIEHTLSGYQSSLGKTGSYTYLFNWTPPAASVGNITVYVAGNAANGDLTDLGDHIYTANYTLTPAAASNLPTISSGGVTGNATALPLIGPNAYVNIMGTNLSSVTDLWTTHITNNVLPTQLDGVTVTIGGIMAYVQYVSPTQIQVLTPPNLGFGSVAVQVTNSAGTSNTPTVTSQQYAPGFFLWANNQPVATHADYSDAMKNGTYAGLTTVPAKPGEYIVLWGTGFGPTTPAIPAGTAVPGGSTIYYTATPVSLTLNGQPMTYYATTLTSGAAGLYQVVAQVPASMPNGDWPLIATVGGVSTPSSVLLTVAQ
jgi:uncharacterized protein (TIGR03437 family)